MLLVSALPFLNPLRNPAARTFWIVLVVAVFMGVLVFYVSDYFYYDYLQQRLNASVLNYLDDARISFNMAAESYPLTRILLGVLVAGSVAAFIIKKKLTTYGKYERYSGKRILWWYIVAFLLLGFGIFGKFSQFNLRWSDAFSLSDNFKANLSLNPFQSFFSTLAYRDTRPDIKDVRKSYSIIADYFGVQNKDSVRLNYERQYSGTAPSLNSPNVIVVICESFSMYRSSMSGNPLNTTPYFNRLCSEGAFFDRCFTPSYPTARGVWATVTSLPDVLGDKNRSASRNPEVVNQQLIMNDFKGYDKFYFLGGDPTWANIKGMLLNNIDSLRLYSQDDFKASKLNVWGIDDKNLFLEANARLTKQQKPFFAIIQTADNHRPYTIPAEDLNQFRKVSYPEDSIRKYGFDNNEQLNAFRYTDFCYQQFFEAAKKEKYYANTIFVFVGDHGIGGNAKAIYPSSWTEQRLTNYHVPLLFYAPRLIRPRLVHAVCSQADIMPSVASLVNLPYYNNSMGRNLFDSSLAGVKYAFTIDHDVKEIGLVSNDYYYLKNLTTGRKSLVSVNNNDPLPPGNQADSIENSMDRFVDAYYETSRYLLFNNRRKR